MLQTRLIKKGLKKTDIKAKRRQQSINTINSSTPPIVAGKSMEKNNAPPHA